MSSPHTQYLPLTQFYTQKLTSWKFCGSLMQVLSHQKLAFRSWSHDRRRHLEWLQLTSLKYASRVGEAGAARAEIKKSSQSFFDFLCRLFAVDYSCLCNRLYLLRSNPLKRDKRLFILRWLCFCTCFSSCLLGAPSHTSFVCKCKVRSLYDLHKVYVCAHHW